jgi:hypothetical protein
MTLGWTDPNGNKTTKSYWRWAASGRHFWEEVPKDEWPTEDKQKAATTRASLESDVNELLSRMGPPGLNAESAVAALKPLGISGRRARAAFYEIVQNMMRYGITRNVVQQQNGRSKTLFHTSEPHNQQIAQSPIQQTTIDTTGLFDEEPIF